MNLKPLLLFAALILSLLTGCGYTLVGAKGEEPVSVSLTRFDDLSREPLYGPQVMRELSRRGIERSDIALDRGGDGLFLQIVLKDVAERPHGFDRSNQPSAYLLVSTADLYLKRGEKEVWKALGVSARTDFTAGEDIASMRANKNVALRALADSLAGEVLRRVVAAARTLKGGDLK